MGKIGEGRTGEVFEGVCPVIGKRVAIKVIKSDLGRAVELVKRFISEAVSVNKINHQNIVDVFAFGQLDDGRHYFIMEFLDGDSLEDWIGRSGRIPLADALPIFRQMADALDAAHSIGIIHRVLS